MRRADRSERPRGRGEIGPHERLASQNHEECLVAATSPRVSGAIFEARGLKGHTWQNRPAPVSASASTKGVASCSRHSLRVSIPDASTPGGSTQRAVLLAIGRPAAGHTRALARGRSERHKALALIGGRGRARGVQPVVAARDARAARRIEVRRVARDGGRLDAAETLCRVRHPAQTVSVRAICIRLTRRAEPAASDTGARARSADLMPRALRGRSARVTDRRAVRVAAALRRTLTACAMLRDPASRRAIVVGPASGSLGGGTQALPVDALGIDCAAGVTPALGSAVAASLCVLHAVLRGPVGRCRTIVIANARSAIATRLAHAACRSVRRLVGRHIGRDVDLRAPPAARAVRVERTAEDRAERVRVGRIYPVTRELVGRVAGWVSLSPARQAGGAPLTGSPIERVRAWDAEALGRIVVAGPVEGTVGRVRADLVTRRSGAGSIVDALVSGGAKRPAARGARAARRAADGRREHDPEAQRDDPGEGACNGSLAKDGRIGHGR